MSKCRFDYSINTLFGHYLSLLMSYEMLHNRVMVIDAPNNNYIKEREKDEERCTYSREVYAFH